MRRFLLIILLMSFFYAPPATAMARTSDPERSPRVDEVEHLLYRWIETNRYDFCGEFNTGEEERLKQLVTEVLVWANTHGNHFEPTHFLHLFPEQNDSIRWCVFPTGGMLFILDSSFLRISLDTTVPESLPSGLEEQFPDKGRWFVAFGSGNRTTLFYFVNMRTSM